MTRFEKYWDIFLKPSHYSHLPANEDETNIVPKRRHMKVRRRGITQKKAYNIQKTAKSLESRKDFNSVLQDTLELTGKFRFFTNFCPILMRFGVSNWASESHRGSAFICVNRCLPNMIGIGNNRSASIIIDYMSWGFLHSGAEVTIFINENVFSTR
jgi:hypothetical protein